MTVGSVDGFSAQAKALFARVEKFQASTVAGNISEWESRDQSPNLEALREAAQLGLTGIEVGRAEGGLGLGFREKVRVAEIIARQSMSLAFSILNSQNVTARLSARGTVAHRMELLPGLLSGHRFGATALTEPGAGSDLGAITTTARRSGSGWRLSGEKAWITNAGFADVFLCYARLHDTSAGSGSAYSTDSDGDIACFVVQADGPGFSRRAPYEVTSGSLIGVGGFTLDDYDVSDGDMIVGPTDAMSDALYGINGARIYVASMCCSMVRSALAAAVDYGQSRTTFGSKLMDHQGWSWMLADVANQLEAAEALTAKAVDVYSGIPSNPSSASGQSFEMSDRRRSEIAAAAAHAKKFASEMAETALARCMQAMGAEGLRSTHPVGRLLSEARLAHYVDGTTQMQNERIARLLPDLYGSALSPAVTVASPPHTVIDLVDQDPGDQDQNGGSASESGAQPSPSGWTEPELGTAESSSDVDATSVDSATVDVTSADEAAVVDNQPAVLVAAAAAPPLPGDEHRLDTATQAPPRAEPGAPPLPPDSMRRSD